MKTLTTFLGLFILGVLIYSGLSGCKGGKFATQPNYSATNTVTYTYTPTITNTPAPGTPTFTPTPFPGETFNSQSVVSNWILNLTQPSSLPVSIIFNSVFSGCSTSTGAIEVTVGYSLPTQAVFIQHNLSTPVSLSGRSVTLILDVTGGWNSDSRSEEHTSELQS